MINRTACILAILLLLPACSAEKQKPDPEFLVNAVEKGMDKVVKTLLEEGADPDVRNGDGMTMLHIAVRSNRSEVVKVLINGGANVNKFDEKDFTPLDYALDFPCEEEIVQLLLNAGAQLKHPNRDEIMEASAIGDTGKLKEFISKKINLLIKDTRDKTPLHLAVENGHAPAVQLLIENGADVNAKIGVNVTPLYLTSSIDVAKILLDNGARPDEQCGLDGETALHAAVRKGNKQLAEVLISGGADINAGDFGSKTPLHTSAISFQLSMARFLLEKGVDINAKDVLGLTPLHIVVIFQRTWARYGFEKKHKKLVTDMLLFLLENGADVNTAAKNGQTPLDSLEMLDSAETEEIKAMLRKHGAVSGKELKKKEEEKQEK